ncbi:MAG: toll/interleukin-1 receptor domain-containing protein [Planctomycetota bacterium]
MDYEYDVFLSYTRQFPFGDWVLNHFLPLLRPYLNQAVNRTAEVFVDQEEIATGDAWPERLQRALACSRCQIAVWCPSYFQSEWCRRECGVMLHRERKVGLRTLKKPGGLVVPINVFDGEHFPSATKSIQYSDCRRFFRVGEGFTKTELYVDFQSQLIPWVDDVAAAIRRAPPWSKQWLTAKWLAVQNNDLLPPNPKFSFPGLD